MIDIILIFGLFVWTIPGLVGAIMSALMIRLAEQKVNAAGLMAIAFGWIAGMTLGGIAGHIVFLTFTSNSFDDVAAWIIGWGITGMITALIGSWTTYKILESAGVTE